MCVLWNNEMWFSLARNFNESHEYNTELKWTWMSLTNLRVISCLFLPRDDRIVARTKRYVGYFRFLFPHSHTFTYSTTPHIHSKQFPVSFGWYDYFCFMPYYDTRSLVKHTKLAPRWISIVCIEQKYWNKRRKKKIHTQRQRQQRKPNHSYIFFLLQFIIYFGIKDHVSFYATSQKKKRWRKKNTRKTEKKSKELFFCI